MRFTPKTENEIASENLMAAGTYDFEITDAEDTTSKNSGADMIKLTLRVFDANGAPRQIFDYLLESIAYKLRHAAEACGLLGDYERGTLEAQSFIGKVGRCKIQIQKDKSGQYPDRNGISDYVVEKSASAPSTRRMPAMAGADRDLDDEIPF